MVRAAGPIQAKGYIHSKCHQAHWELAMDDQHRLSLVCVKCHHGAGPEIEIQCAGILSAMGPAAKGMLDMMHSPCCKGHWELLVADAGLYIACEKCGRIPGDVIVTMKGEVPPCACCGGEMYS